MEKQAHARSTPSRIHPDRVRLLLDSICTDFITAQYASHENAHRVLLHALEKLYIILSPTKLSHKDTIITDTAQTLHTALCASLQTYKSHENPLTNDSHFLYSEENHIRDLLTQHLQQFCHSIQENLASHILETQSTDSVSSLIPLKDIQNETFTASASEAAAQFITPPPRNGEVRMEGWLRKKGQHVNFWRERYFMIKTSTDNIHYLCYFRKKGDREPRGWYVLGPGTMVDSVRESPSKIETKRLFTFRIRNYTHASFEEAHLEELYPVDSTRVSQDPQVPLPDSNVADNEGNALFRRSSSRHFKSRAAAAAAAATAATAVVLTGGLAGVGIGVGMGMSAAAAAAASAGAAGAYMTQQSRQHTMVALAAESFETAIWWRNSILDCILQAEEAWRQYLTTFMDEIQRGLPSETQKDVRAGTEAYDSVSRSMTRFRKDGCWNLLEFSTKMRVYIEKEAHRAWNDDIPAMRTSVRVHASPNVVLQALLSMDSAFYQQNHVIDRAHIVHTNAEDQSDIIYYRLSPTFLWPIHARARELCLLRHWQKDPNGSYIIRFHSICHAKCPLSFQCTRASISRGAFLICPRIDSETECYVTLTCRMNPNGWLNSRLSRLLYYFHAYVSYFLEIVSYLPNLRSEHFSEQRTRAKSENDTIENEKKRSKSIDLLPNLRTDLSIRHCLATKYWSEPCASSFRVRGRGYLTKGIKIPSSRQTFRLLGVQLLESHAPIEHIGLEYVDGLEGYTGFDVEECIVQKPSSYGSAWVWIVNIMFPDPPYRSLILYFTPEDLHQLRQNSPFADLCHRFMHGPSDSFRRDRLKLIPRVIQGARSIQNGIHTTPSILGTKMYQKYYSERRYLEMDYDIGSSHVAKELIKLLLSHSQNLIMDLALVIEGKEEMELPERILATVRLSHVNLQDAVRHSTTHAYKSK